MARRKKGSAAGDGDEVEGIAADRLRSIIERIERLEEERKALADDIKDIFSEAKSAGFAADAARSVSPRPGDVRPRRLRNPGNRKLMPMTPAATRHAATLIEHLTKDATLSTLPLSVRGVWLHLALAMIDKPHTGHGLNADPDRLAEMVVCRLDEVRGAIATLHNERMIECGADGYLRMPFVMRLMRPAGAR